jgi:inositol-phosphate transport system permease protein
MPSLIADLRERRITGQLPFLFFLAPTLLLILVFYVLPIIYTILMSFTDMNMTFDWDFTGLENYRRIFLADDPRIPRVLFNTVIYTVFALLITVGLGLVIAIMTTQMREEVGIFFRVVWLLPNIIPPVVYILLWKWFFDPSRHGFLNSILYSLDKEPQLWLVHYALLIVIPVNAFIGLSFAMIVFTSTIKSIPSELMDAARVDGAGSWQMIRHITLPMLRWPLTFMVIWHLIGHLNSYVYILLLTNGGPLYRSTVWALYAYHRSFQNNELGYGAALALLLVIVSGILTLVVWRVFDLEQLMNVG